MFEVIAECVMDGKRFRDDLFKVVECSILDLWGEKGSWIDFSHYFEDFTDIFHVF